MIEKIKSIPMNSIIAGLVLLTLYVTFLVLFPMVCLAMSLAVGTFWGMYTFVRSLLTDESEIVYENFYKRFSKITKELKIK